MLTLFFLSFLFACVVSGAGLGNLLGGLGKGIGVGTYNLFNGLLGGGRYGGRLWGGRVLPTTMPVKWRIPNFFIPPPFPHLL